MFNQNLELFQQGREAIQNQADSLRNTFNEVNGKTNLAEKIGSGMEQAGSTVGGLIGTYAALKHLAIVAKEGLTKAGGQAGEAAGEEAGEAGVTMANTSALPAEVEMTTISSSIGAQAEDATGVVANLGNLGDGVTASTFAATSDLPAVVSGAGDLTTMVGNSANTANLMDSLAPMRAAMSAMTANEGDPEAVGGLVAEGTEGITAATGSAVEGGTAAVGSAVEGGTAAVGALGSGVSSAIEGGTSALIETTALEGGLAAAPETGGLSLVGAAVVAGITALVGALTSAFGGDKPKPFKMPNVMSVGGDFSNTPEGPATATGTAF